MSRRRRSFLSRRRKRRSRRGLFEGLSDRFRQRQRTRRQRVRQRGQTRRARIEAKGESGYWSPEAVQARTGAISSIVDTAGDVAGAYLTGEGPEGDAYYDTGGGGGGGGLGIDPMYLALGGGALLLLVMSQQGGRRRG